MAGSSNRLNKVSLCQGQTKTLLVTIKRHDGGKFNLNGYSFRLVVAESVRSTTLLLDKTTGFTIIRAEEGQFTIILTSVETDITPGCYVYDLVLTKGGTDPAERYVVVCGAPFVVKDTVAIF